jgi:hypothetical protein
MEKKNKIQKIKKENNQLVNQKKLESQLDRLLEGQEINRELIYKGFIGLAQQNQELLESNKELTQKLEILVEELTAIKQEGEEKEIRKQAWANWKRLPKRDPSSYKAFLTKEGKKILQDRQKDFQLIFLMKESDSYIFTSESDHSQMIRRETITKDVNQLTRTVSDQIPGKPNI